MDVLDAIRSHVLALPDLAKFAVIIAAIVGVPRLADRIGLPPMVGLLLFWVIWGRTCSVSSASIGRLLISPPSWANCC